MTALSRSREPARRSRSPRGSRTLGAHGVPLIDYPAADLERDLSERASRDRCARCRPVIYLAGSGHLELLPRFTPKCSYPKSCSTRSSSLVRSTRRLIGIR